ncbi:LamG domain-containing protein [Candidatus Pacearchaeota archaeon]|nr:LamG domain-containing protein [Candidatus Pacearchaeota archaeon]
MKKMGRKMVLSLFGIALVVMLSMLGSALDLSRGNVLYFKFNNWASLGEKQGEVHDLAGSHLGSASGALFSRTDGVGAYQFDGVNDKITVADANDLSPSTTNAFTVSLWVKFDRTSFVGEGSHKDYVHFLGKSSSGNHEFVFRQYNSSNNEKRNNRISFYMFNLDGGLGSGSYVQEPIIKGEWMFLTGVYDGTHVQIWKNGVLKDQDNVKDYHIVPANGKAPLTLGTSDGSSYFKGSMDEMRVYNRALTQSEIQSLYHLGH